MSIRLQKLQFRVGTAVVRPLSLHRGVNPFSTVIRSRLSGPGTAFDQQRRYGLSCSSISSGNWRVYSSDVDAEEQMLELEDDAATRMEKCLATVKGNVATVRTGRATPNMLDRVEVEYYGAMTPLKSLAGISVPDSSTLQIQPFDMSALGSIERAILQSDLDLTPNNDGKVIRINIPPLTEERRKEMIKKVNALGEEGKVAVRNVRRDILKALGKVETSEDSKKDMENEIQAMTDKKVKEIDSLVAAKSKELSTV